MKSYTPKLRGDTCKVGSGGNKYNVGGKRIDEVILRFDEDEQKFYARIVNPSPHTQYLFEHDRLGIMLSRGDIGQRTRLSCFDTGMKFKNYGGNKVKRLYHPRWYGVSGSLTHINSLDVETELPSDIGFFPVCHCSWDRDRVNFTYLKAVLVSLHNPDVSRYGFGYFRPYHTYCTRLKIRWTNSNHISLRSGGLPTSFTTVDISPISEDVYQIHFSNIGPSWEQAFERESVRVVLLITNIGVTCGCHGCQRFTRSLYRNTNSTLAIVYHWSLYENDDTISLTNLPIAHSQQISSLIALRNKHNDARDVFINRVMLGVQIGYDAIIGITEIPYHIVYPIDDSPGHLVPIS